MTKNEWQGNSDILLRFIRSPKLLVKLLIILFREPLKKNSLLKRFHAILSDVENNCKFSSEFRGNAWRINGQTSITERSVRYCIRVIEMEESKKFFEAKYESPLFSSLNQISQMANKCIYTVKGEKYNNSPR